MNQEEINKDEALEQPTMGFFSRVTGALFSPTKTFAYLDKRPDIWGAMIVIIIFTLCFSLLYVQKTDMKIITLQRLEQQGRTEQMTEEQLDQAVNIGAKIGKYMMIVGAFIGTPISFLIIGGILYLIFKLLQGETTFKKVFSVVSYSYLPGVFASLIGIILLLTKTTNEILPENLVKSNLSILLVQEEVSKFLWNLSSSIDIFSIWVVILLSICMAVLKKTKLINSFLIVGGLWIVWIVISSLLRGLTG